MADGTQEIIEILDNHPCKSPRGMLYYNVEVLTKDQQTKLNKLKINTVRENEKYLAAHPEVRAIVALITRIVFKNRPRSNIHGVVIEYFKQPREIIQNDIDNYIREREPHVYEGDSAVVSLAGEEERLIEEYYEEEPSISVLSEIQEEELENIPLEILNEIIEKALKDLDIEVDDDERAIKRMLEDEIISRVGITLSEDLRSLLEREMWEKISRMNTGAFDSKEPSVSSADFEVPPSEVSTSVIKETIKESIAEAVEEKPSEAKEEKSEGDSKPQSPNEDQTEKPAEETPAETTTNEEKQE